jgi:hypothetical protein
MSLLFDILECPEFGPQMASLKDHEQELIIEAIQSRLNKNPMSRRSPVRSEMLSDNLECLRRIHADDDLLIFYVVCQECRDSPFCQSKIGCFECHKIGPYTVILVACGYWIELYEHILSDEFFRWLRNVKFTYEFQV